MAELEDAPELVFYKDLVKPFSAITLKTECKSGTFLGILVQIQVDSPEAEGRAKEGTANQ